MTEDEIFYAIMIFGAAMICACIFFARLERKWDRDQRMGIRPGDRRATDPFWSRKHNQRKISAVAEKETA